MRRRQFMSVSALAVCGSALSTSALLAQDSLLSWEQLLPQYEQQNILKNRRWVIQRQTQKAGSTSAKVGVVVGPGVWNCGAQSIVACLERSKVNCKVFESRELANPALAEEAEGTRFLKGLTSVILPGGFAPYQWQALGALGLSHIVRFIEQGGRCLGICAGGYLLSSQVRYAGVTYTYPTQLFDGVAEGPIAGLPVFPQVGPVQLTATKLGEELGLASWVKSPALFGSGPRFVGGTNVQVLLKYPDGSTAVFFRPYGQGHVLAVGAHYERPVTGGEEAPPPVGCERGFKLLLNL